MRDFPPFEYCGEAHWREPLIRALHCVIDPELAMSIMDLGLVYGAVIDKDTVRVRMTMTSAACPVTDLLVEEVYLQLESLFPDEVKLGVELVWTPPWSPARMTAEARQRMGWA